MGAAEAAKTVGQSMDVATTIAAWLALTLGIPTATVAAFQVQHHIRFRRPVFTIKEIELPVKRKAGITFAGPGNIVLNARGARYPVTLTWWGCFLFTSGSKQGTGSGIFTEGKITLEPEVWTELPSLPFGGGSIPDDLPSILYGEVDLSNPRDMFIVPIELKLTGGGARYSLDQIPEELRYARRGWDRGRHGFAGVLRAFRARLPRARR
jgi:hypothetical protein